MLGLTSVLGGQLGGLAFGQQKPVPLGTGLGTPIPKEALKDPLYAITRATFLNNLDTKFSFSLGSVFLADLVLIGVQDLNPPYVKSDGTGNRDCFALVFQGPSRLPLRQGTYIVSHKTLGTFSLFVVPGNRAAKPGPNYVALINRMYP
jgi:hypothetical protein